MPVRLRRLASLEIGHCMEVFKKCAEGGSLSVLLSGSRMRLGTPYEERKGEAKQHKQISDTEILQVDGGVSVAR